MDGRSNSARVETSRATASAPAGALELRAFGVAFGERVVLDDLCAELPRHGLTVLVGPAGGGKSTLVRTLSGLNDAHPSLGTWGEVRLGGELLPWNGRRHTVGNCPRPTLVLQHARFFLDTVSQNLIGGLPDRAAHARSVQLQIVREALQANGLTQLVPLLEKDAVSLPLAEQRCLSIVRAVLANPAVLFADEPTAGLDDAGAEAVVRLLQAQAEQRSVLFVTHHQRLACVAGGTTLLLANGKIQESAPTQHFFSAPATELGRTFVRTGSCLTISPGGSVDGSGASGDEQASGANELQPAPAPSLDRDPARGLARRRPRGFSWTITGKLGGLPRPGIIDHLHDDLSGLVELGVTVLVTLEEQRTVDPKQLAALGIESEHFPIVDMGVPDLTSTLELCARVHTWLTAGKVVAFHCLAGFGRTGTMLACQLIYGGRSARSALDHVRAVNPRHVQSAEQVAFLRELELALLDCGDEERPINEPPEPL